MKSSKSSIRRWRLQFGLGTIFLLITAIAIGLAWVTRADRFYDLPRVYGFTESAPDGSPQRSGIAFVLQHRFFPQHRRLQWVVFLDVEENQPLSDSATVALEMKEVGRYEIARYEYCHMLSIPDVQSKYGWGLCVEDFDFGSGAVFAIKDMRDRGLDDLATIINGAFALDVPYTWPTLTWEELLAFISDSSVQEWDPEAVTRWKAER